jgi:hypothetical protein
MSGHTRIPPIVTVGDLPLGWSYIRGHGVIWHITNDDSSVRHVATLCSKKITVSGWTRGHWAVGKNCRKCCDLYRESRSIELLGGPAA